MGFRVGITFLIMAALIYNATHLPLMQIKHQQKVGGLQIEETNWHKIKPYHCPPMPATISSLQFFIPA
jgi:hypothetical protein